jgi:hypothetical protein
MRSAAEAMAPAALAFEKPDANTLYRRVLGIDEEHRAMTAGELALLEDPLGKLLRSGAPFPLTLRQLLQSLDALGASADAVPDQLVFLVADGGHIPWSPETDGLERAFRFVVARNRGGDFRLLVSSSTLVDSAEDRAFLQVIGWDSVHEVFHYYERLFGTFFWAGSSPHALEDATRGQGPFDSHVNGSLVMKELRPPWIHWHAPQAGINDVAFAPNDPLVHDPLFVHRVTAERLETEIVRPGIRRWYPPVERGAGAQGGRRRRRLAQRSALRPAGDHRHDRESRDRGYREQSRRRRHHLRAAALVLHQPRPPFRHARPRA